MFQIDSELSSEQSAMQIRVSHLLRPHHPLISSSRPFLWYPSPHFPNPIYSSSQSQLHPHFSSSFNDAIPWLTSFFLSLLGFCGFFYNSSALCNFFHQADPTLDPSHSLFPLIMLYTSAGPEGEEMRPRDSCFLFFFQFPALLWSTATRRSSAWSISLSPRGISHIQHKVSSEKLALKLRHVSPSHG